MSGFTFTNILMGIYLQFFFHWRAGRHTGMYCPEYYSGRSHTHTHTHEQTKGCGYRRTAKGVCLESSASLIPVDGTIATHSLTHSNSDRSSFPDYTHIYCIPYFNLQPLAGRG